MSKIYRKNAKGKQCTLRIHGSANCSDTDTVVLAHCRLNNPDKGIGYKPGNNLWAAFACARCHDIIDGRTLPGKGQGWIPDEAKAEIWLQGIYETQRMQGVFDE